MPEFYTKQRSLSVEKGFLLPNEQQIGFSQGYAFPASYDQAADYFTNSQRDMMEQGRISISDIVEGGKYRFGSGTVTAPAIAWSADTNTGFYWVSSDAFAVTCGGVQRVLFQAAAPQLKVTGAATITTYLNVGTTTDAGVTGEFAVGVAGSNRFVFVGQILEVIDSSNVVSFRIDSENGRVIFEDRGNALSAGDVRMNGTNLTFHDGTAARNLFNKLRKNSAGTIFSRSQLNLIEGTNISLTVADDAGNGEIDITIATSSTDNAADSVLRYERFF